MSPQLAFVWWQNENESPKKKKFFFFFFFFRETPTSPWVPFRAKFWPLGRLFRPSRPLAWSLRIFSDIYFSKEITVHLCKQSVKTQQIVGLFGIQTVWHWYGIFERFFFRKKPVITKSNTVLLSNFHVLQSTTSNPDGTELLRVIVRCRELNRREIKNGCERWGFF